MKSMRFTLQINRVRIRVVKITKILMYNNSKCLVPSLNSDALNI